ncbi:PadR family transcriptional regulator [Ornithinimicrobium pratense]|uniref:Helix-turn-helix transcriptional regulator n=1 Tax=Ornithinimicrobium pratense TaxID=2593973 RepID=A0A5J6V909_9MICO|nr:PadR family transcriptional regulator [Ornithinimicrobium pratense]QFG69611.1 helix-turn-helix transcriptional regulator [Ornithinimicrobium pratense]
MNSRHHGPGSFGGFGFDPDQIFGPNGLLNQVFGSQGGGGWGGSPWGPRPPRPPHPGSHQGPRSGRRARRGDVRNAILHLLQREPMNGYQLMQEIAQSSGGAWQPSSGAIYPALSLLEDEGLVEQHDVDGRKAYQLTDAGRHAAGELPRQAWMGTGGAEPDDPWAREEREQPDAWSGGGGRGRDHDRHGGGRRERGAQLWKALGSVAMATQAVGQAGDHQLSREAAGLLDRTRRDLYRLLADAEVARGEEERDDLGDLEDDIDGEITDAEIVDED